MTDIKAQLIEAAVYLDYLFEGSRHVPMDLRHSKRIRGRVEDGDENTVALFFYGGVPEVFLALGPSVLPLLARWLRTEVTYGEGIHDESCQAGWCQAMDALALADHILKSKEVATWSL